MLFAQAAEPAQSTRQSFNVTVTITDEQGDSLPGVTVTLLRDGAEIALISDVEGTVRFRSAPNDRIQIRSELEGFRRASRKITVARDESIILKMKLALSEPIIIACPPPQLPEPFTFTISPWFIQGGVLPKN